MANTLLRNAAAAICTHPSALSTRLQKLEAAPLNKQNTKIKTMKHYDLSLT
jgi:hypothetical protein